MNIPNQSSNVNTVYLLL